MTAKNRDRKTRSEAMATVANGEQEEKLLSLLLEHLMYMRQQLLKIDPDSLDGAEHEQWRTLVNQVSLAIGKVRNAMLAMLNVEFAAELPQIESAASRLTDDLYKLQKANEIIETIAGGIGAVAKILALLP